MSPATGIRACACAIFRRHRPGRAGRLAGLLPPGAGRDRVRPHRCRRTAAARGSARRPYAEPGLTAGRAARRAPYPPKRGPSGVARGLFRDKPPRAPEPPPVRETARMAGQPAHDVRPKIRQSREPLLPGASDAPPHRRMSMGPRGHTRTTLRQLAGPRPVLAAAGRPGAPGTRHDVYVVPAPRRPPKILSQALCSSIFTGQVLTAGPPVRMVRPRLHLGVDEEYSPS